MDEEKKPRKSISSAEILLEQEKKLKQMIIPQLSDKLLGLQDLRGCMRDFTQSMTPNTSLLSDSEISALTRNPTYADRKYEILKEEIDEFQNNLSDNEDIVIKLASFGNSVLMYVESIGYYNPDILIFEGNVDGAKARLIQHMGQLNFMLLAHEKEDPNKRPNRIGFAVNTED